MRSNNLIFMIFLLSACSPNVQTSAPAPSLTTSCPTGDNVMKVTVNGSLCDPNNQYQNEPCTSVTVCSVSDPSNCQTITNILLDTGSIGLRIFRTALTIPVTDQNLFECAQFGDGSSLWGHVDTALVKLGNEPSVQTPIMVIESSAPGNCSNAEKTPSKSGFNGILGVGFYQQDCGQNCTGTTPVSQYFTCADNICSATSVDLKSQLQNPVALLPSHNNGVILQFSSIDPTGVTSLDGCMILGIDTVSSKSKLYSVDKSGNMSTVFAAYQPDPIPGFIDSGSNGLYFPAPNDGTLPACAKPSDQFYCPKTIQALSATNNEIPVSFSIRNANSFTTNVRNEIGGNALTAGSPSVKSSAYFDWGLPFFFGRTIYVGIEGKNSSLGTGPYWAY